MEFPKHACSLSLEHNPQRGVYQTVAQYLEEIERDAEPIWASPQDRQKAINEDNIWILQWYPRTPVGFQEVAASTLEGVLALANDKGK